MQVIPILNTVQVWILGLPRYRSELFRTSGSHRDVFTVICVLDHGDLGSVWSFKRFIADEYPLFQVRVFQGLFDGDLLFIHFDSFCGLFPSLELSSAGVAPLPPCFYKLLSEDSHDICRFSLLDVLSRWRRQLHVVRAVQYE